MTPGLSFTAKTEDAIEREGEETYTAAEDVVTHLGLQESPGLAQAEALVRTASLTAAIVSRRLLKP